MECKRFREKFWEVAGRGLRAAATVALCFAARTFGLARGVVALARPSGRDIELALEIVDGLFARRLASCASMVEAAAARARVAAERDDVMGVLREAVAPRPVWPTKEAAAALGVDPSNLNRESVAGLPEPAQRIPRPTEHQPGRTTRLWFVDEIEECAARKRARARNNGEDVRA